MAHAVGWLTRCTRERRNNGKHGTDREAGPRSAAQAPAEDQREPGRSRPRDVLRRQARRPDDPNPEDPYAQVEADSVTSRTVIAGAIVLAALPALADMGSWTERDICRAAVKTYFFLKELPADAADQAEYLGFTSAAGNVYTCRLSGERAVFRWLTKGGKPMRSRLTRFHVSHGVLVIKTDMSSETFEK